MSSLSGVDREVYEHGNKLLSQTVPVEIFNEMVTLRRQLHETPELAFEEHATAALIRQALAAIEGCTVVECAAGVTGILAVIEGQAGPGKTLLFRADLDGLPIQEASRSPSPPLRKSLLVSCTLRCTALCG